MRPYFAFSRPVRRVTNHKFSVGPPTLINRFSTAQSRVRWHPRSDDPRRLSVIAFLPAPSFSRGLRDSPLYSKWKPCPHTSSHRHASCVRSYGTFSPEEPSLSRNQIEYTSSKLQWLLICAKRLLQRYRGRFCPGKAAAVDVGDIGGRTYPAQRFSLAVHTSCRSQRLLNEVMPEAHSCAPFTPLITLVKRRGDFTTGCGRAG